ncbi:protein phosphatase 1 regulatory subunit 15B [Brachyhypopomus gauderio]|uniref:protein phosphatase 1 regulatory subunit 15B n=1 Tax=Brachyhypopomus gauderio TaxID=698409 RepID=UPI004042E987
MAMFRTMSSEEHFCNGTSQSPSTGLERANVSRNESSWVSMLSLFSRPAWTLLQKYLPGRSHASSLTNCSGEAGKSKIVIENSLVVNLGNLMPATQLSAGLGVACVHCLHENARHLSSSDTQTPNWLTEEPLRELGIQNPARVEAQHLAPAGYLTMARRFLSQVLLNMASSSQKDAGRAERGQPQLESWYGDPVAVRSTKSWSWDLLRGADDPQNVLPSLSQSGRETNTESPHCQAACATGHRHPADRSSAGAVAKPMELFVHSDDVESIPGETTGLLCVKEPTDNGGLHMPGLESLPSTNHLPSSVHQHSVVGLHGDTKAILTPEQDSGYSSLEEENANAKQHVMMLVCEKSGQSELDGPGPSQENEAGSGGDGEGPVGDSPSAAAGTSEEHQEEVASASEPASGSQASSLLPVPHCPNKAIAYIMGGPCSDDSDSEDDSDWDDDDDGFDSEGSSDSEVLDDSDDEDESEGDGLNPDGEALWKSLCQNADPYSPRNFTAPMRTAPSPGAAEACSPPSGSPAGLASSPSSSPSPLQLEEEESDDEAHSIDEEESLKLWNSFNCSSDPYSPLNFRAPVRTRDPGRACCKKGRPVGPPLYRKEEAEERLDSGFSEAAVTQAPHGSGRLKKVTFAEEVEEFYASSDEDRRGPWEEFARDRCRFQRRVQEVEETISYCLAPTFRLLTFQRLHHS